MKTSLKLVLSILLFFLGSSAFSQNLAILPKMTIYKFKSTNTKTIVGTSKERPTPTLINETDKIGNAGVVSLYYQNSCYTGGTYNHENYKIEQGIASSSSNSFEAYKVHPPSHKATKFLASNHCLYYKFPKKEAFTIYQLVGEKVSLVREFKASEVKTNQYTKIEEINLSTLEEAETYFFVPSSMKMSAYKQLGIGTEAAFIKSNSIADIYKYRYNVKYGIFNSEASYQDKARKFFTLKPTSKTFATVWQEDGDAKTKIILTSISPAFNFPKHKELPNTINGKLAAVATDGKGNVYYLTVKDFTQKTSKVMLYKVNSSGKLISKKEHDASKKGLNIFNYGNYGATMEYANGKLLLMIGRTMHKSSDGLNHQGGIAVSFDAKTLAKIKNFGQTSGHSFDNTLTTNTKGEFIGTDLGDNYPRGIHLHEIKETRRSSKIIVTFKTQHGSRASYASGMPSYPSYPEISGNGKQFYKWSNDNNTYTSLGGTHEVKGGYAVVFASEASPSGKLLDNSRAGTNEDPMNIGFVKVVSNFGEISSIESKVSKDLIASKGISETGHFYTFGGHLSEQANHGIIWLTSIKPKTDESVRHLKTALLPSGNIFLLWEVETKSNSAYKNTYSMIINSNGKVIKSKVEVGENIRLTKRDELLVSGDKVYLTCGNKVEAKLEIVVFKLK